LTTISVRAVAVALAMAAAFLVACGQSDGATEVAAGGEELLGSSFVSTEVRQNGEPVSLKGEPFGVGFEQRDDGPLVRWSGGCNATGGAVEITSTRLRLQGPAGRAGGDSTAIGCPPELERADRWMATFMAGGPEWELQGDQLILEAGNRTLIMRRSEG
jgi:heat shock protein HslJ